MGEEESKRREKRRKEQREFLRGKGGEGKGEGDTDEDLMSDDDYYPQDERLSFEKREREALEYHRRKEEEKERTKRKVVCGEDLVSEDDEEFSKTEEDVEEGNMVKNAQPVSALVKLLGQHHYFGSAERAGGRAGREGEHEM